jgi:hypothetical protein
MADLLLLGMTHFPRLRLPDDQWAGLFEKMLADPAVPAHLQNPTSWPQGLREEWGNDRGLSAAREQRKTLAAEFALMRDELDRFHPDFVLIWGDDQYENFKEDGIPPFAVLAYDSVTADRNNPKIGGSKPLPPDQRQILEPITVQGHRQGAKHFASELIECGFDVTYAYRPRHRDLGHAFLNTALFLGADKKPLPWPFVPFAVNCYGRIVIAQHGGPRGLSETATLEPDPPSPPPWRCFDLGAACARIAQDSPWRIAIVASSSWSHAFMTRKHYFLYPDIEADRQLFADLVSGNYQSWRARSTAQIEASGQQEVLNWVCLAGALDALNLKLRYSKFHESYLFNSSKVFAIGGGLSN